MEEQEGGEERTLCTADNLTACTLLYYYYVCMMGVLV